MSVIWSGVTEEGAVVPVQVTAEGKVVAVGDGPEGEYLKLTGGNLTGNLTVNEQITLSTDGSATFAGDVEPGRINVRNGGSGNSAIRTFDASGNQVFRAYGEGGVWIGDASNPGKIQLNGNGGATFASDVNIGGSATFAGSIITGTNGAESLLAKNNRPDLDNNATIYAANEGGGVVFMGGPSHTLAQKTSKIMADGSSTFAGGKCGFTSEGELIFTSRNERYKLVVSNGLCQAEPYTLQMELKEMAEQFVADKRETKPSDQSEVGMDNDNA